MWMSNDLFNFIEPIAYIEGKCVAFDLDGCLITKANAQLPAMSETDSDNFVFMYNVEKTINDLLDSGRQVVIITNQRRFNQAKGEMIQKIWEHFNGRILVLASHLDNEYRKPKSGFVTLLQQTYEIEYYCGDAMKGYTDFPPYQWGDCDIQFAINSKIPFRSPLDVFGSNFKTIIPSESLIIMCGMQGSGKTSVAKRLESMGFERFSKDEADYLAKKRIKAITEFLQAGKQVVVDATHYNNKVRSVWIDFAQSLGFTWHILWCVRDGRVFNSLRDKPVPEVGIRFYPKNFERPTSNFTVVN